MVKTFLEFKEHMQNPKAIILINSNTVSVLAATASELPLISYVHFKIIFNFLNCLFAQHVQ